MSKSDILLVGAGGYIGSNCPFPCDKIDLKYGMDFLKAAIREYKAIIFLASRIEDFGEEDYVYNKLLYRRLDKWLRKYHSTHVIYSSSAAVYGESTGDPSKENEYLIPINLYGRSKLAGEYHVREYDIHTVLRFANVYGGQGGHGVTEAFQGGQAMIYGDGEQVRDFVPVSKIWEIIQLALEYPHLWQGVYNVSLSKPSTINDWYKKHGIGEPVHTDPRAGDIRTSVLDNSKMKEHIALCQPL